MRTRRGTPSGLSLCFLAAGFRISLFVLHFSLAIRWVHSDVRERMEATYKTASWTPSWYGQDQSFVKGMRDILFVSDSESSSEDFILTARPGSVAVKAIVYSIAHSDYGEVHGFYNDGLEYHIHFVERAPIIVNAEEDPGEIFGSTERLSDDPFIITLRNPIETGVTIEQYRSLFILETRKLVATFDNDRKSKALGVAKPEQGAAG